MRLLKTLLAAALLLPWTATGQDKAPAGAVPAPRAFIWEVASLTNRIYLYGTVHAGKKSFFPLAEPVEKAFAESSVLVVEADITDAEAMARSAQTTVYKPPDTLEKHVAPEQYARFRKQLERLSLPEPQMARMKPFMAASLLAFAEWGRLGYFPQYGVDGNLIQRAKEAGKRVVELEGAEAQTRIMDSLTDEESRDAFEGALTALESGIAREQITGMVNAWQSGDADLLLEVARRYNENVRGAKEMEEKFIWSRHDEMVARISAYLLESKERHFVAVGALHLAGPRGLVELLKKRGFMARQL
jgi:uncharacterized protein YbaP (TraB family)